MGFSMLLVVLINPPDVLGGDVKVEVCIAAVADDDSPPDGVAVVATLMLVAAEVAESKAEEDVGTDVETGANDADDVCSADDITSPAPLVPVAVPTSVPVVLLASEAGARVPPPPPSPPGEEPASS